jgi:hypothetical protein
MARTVGTRKPHTYMPRMVGTRKPSSASRKQVISMDLNSAADWIPSVRVGVIIMSVGDVGSTMVKKC